MTAKYVMREVTCEVPLDHTRPSGPKIELFAREVCLPGNEKADIFVFLQGGPGFPAPRDPDAYAWITALLKKHRIVFVDQRGTGRSTRIDPSLADSVKDAAKQAEHFGYFRADSIVCDCEWLRRKIFKVPQWFLLGQSYGGFLSFTYLSMFPEALLGVITTGGCPPLTASSVDAVYDRLLDGIIKRNAEFYAKYPKDAATVRRIVDVLEKDPYVLPDGGKLTAQRFLDIGLKYLGATRNIDLLHHFLDDAFLDSSQKRLAYGFVHACTTGMSFETNPIYAVLHESIYCDGSVSNWSASRRLEARPAFALDAKKPLFTGETIRKAMFDEYALLRRFKKAAGIVAARKDWGPLYDVDKLAANKVPVECLVYETDYYVDHAYSLEAVEATRNARAYVHKTWQHDSLRVHGKDVVGIMLPRLLRRVAKR